jgi:hypothetical protein
MWKNEKSNGVLKIHLFLMYGVKIIFQYYFYDHNYFFCKNPQKSQMGRKTNRG